METTPWKECLKQAPEKMGSAFTPQLDDLEHDGTDKCNY